MARYIDADEIKFTGFTFEDEHKEVYVKLSDVKQAVQQTPTSDVEEVVRCKDCKYKEECWQKVDCEYSYKEIVYCSYGERRDT